MSVHYLAAYRLMRDLRRLGIDKRVSVFILGPRCGKASPAFDGPIHRVESPPSHDCTFFAEVLRQLRQEKK